MREERSAEWQREDWVRAWSIRVGRAYGCSKCGSMIMCTKGGVGVLEPICCGKPMELIKTLDEIRDEGLT